MTVVVAYSEDDQGRAALAHGVAEARLRDTDLVVVNATRGDSYVDRRFAAGSAADHLREELVRLGVDAVVRQPIDPDVAGAVLAVVAEVGADELVIGIRHRSPVGKMIAGSVAQRLLLDSPVPVLAVKPDGPAHSAV
ncbi:universal stress protein [Mumia sp. zg.B53]|uniref:universal stress protein n=1 Tax=unclassified Mumia TaxID=2621872 RepID=UPI001C6EFC3A|nr:MULTISPECIES: universal stress protein [unclassified Mumia]MBW9205986.1 universal stress protein [Mumia sp. zg.B17]MBW9211732.1 universal stress protein [Mumia sp. zg.B21]MBW9216892.1 universal stress protein [Mumia sp. zg.B53]MDD9347400.1 universal stress protein [Mumia sp.]